MGYTQLTILFLLLFAIGVVALIAPGLLLLAIIVGVVVGAPLVISAIATRRDSKEPDAGDQRDLERGR